MKGAYDEKAAVAFRSSREVDANYLGLAVTLIRESRAAASGSDSVPTTWS